MLTTGQRRFAWPHEPHLLASYPEPFRDYLRLSLSPLTDELPMYMQLGATLARVVLLFKSPSFRAGGRDGRPRCLWCLELGLECGAHLLECRRIPPHLWGPRVHIRMAVIQESGVPYSNAQANAFIWRMDWPHQTMDLVRRVAICLRRMLSEYRLRSVVDPRTGQRPIWPV